MIKKKGDVWVSAVLYIALGMVIITLILSAGLPLIEKMRDKNTIAQTKRMIFNLNSNIESVANEGAGSKRYISPFEITSGSLIFDFDNELIIWKMTTKSLTMEPNKLKDVEDCIEQGKMNSIDCTSLVGTKFVTFTEGALIMWMVETPIEGEYDSYVELSYRDRNPPHTTIYNLKTIDPRSVIPIAGKYNLGIKHTGFEQGTDTPLIQIDLT